MSDYFIAHERDQIFRRLELLQPDSTTPSGRVNGHQSLLHLTDDLHVALGERQVPQAGTLLHRTVIRWAVFNFTPWPEREPADASAIERFVGPQPAGEFAADFSHFVNLLQRFDARARTGSLAAHPVYGRLDRTDWGKYMYLHIDWHLSRLGL